MLTRTKRYIIPTGSYNAICSNLQDVNTTYCFNATAVTSSCNWPNHFWCDVTFTCDTSASFDAAMSSNILITKQVWHGVRETVSGSITDTHDIQFI
jgi:hypothetical protein